MDCTLRRHLIKIGGEGVLFEAPRTAWSTPAATASGSQVTATLVQDDKPDAPTVGTLWYDTGTTAELYVYDGLQWVSMTGGGSGGDGPGFADNNTEDNIPAELEDKGLVRTISAEGEGEWRQPTTADIVAVGEEPMLMSPDTFDTPADQVTTQQQANWYLYNAITGGEGSGGLFLKKSGDTMTGDLSFKPDDQRFGYFNIKGERPDGWNGALNYGVRFQINDNTAYNKFVIQTNSESEAFFLQSGSNAQGKFNVPLSVPTVPDNAWRSSLATNAEYVWNNYLPKKGGDHYVESASTEGAYRIKSQDSGKLHLHQDRERQAGPVPPSGPDQPCARRAQGLRRRRDREGREQHRQPWRYLYAEVWRQFTGAVKYSNVNDNGGSSLTLMHKDAFSSVLTNFQMGDRRYHGIHCSRASYPGYPSVELKSSSSSTNVPDLKVTNNGSQTTFSVFGQDGKVTAGRSASPFMASENNELVTLAKANDLIARGGSTAKAANKQFEYRANGNVVISGGFTFKTETLMLLDHRERIDGENVTWNPVSSDLGTFDVPMVYSIYTAGERSAAGRVGNHQPHADGLQGHRLHHTMV